MKAKTGASHALTYFNLARAYVSKGMLRSALSSLDECIRLEPLSGRAKELRLELDRHVM